MINTAGNKYLTSVTISLEETHKEVLKVQGL